MKPRAVNTATVITAVSGSTISTTAVKIICYSNIKSNFTLQPVRVAIFEYVAVLLGDSCTCYCVSKRSAGAVASTYVQQLNFPKHTKLLNVLGELNFFPAEITYLPF